MQHCKGKYPGQKIACSLSPDEPIFETSLRRLPFSWGFLEHAVYLWNAPTVPSARVALSAMRFRLKTSRMSEQQEQRWQKQQSLCPLCDLTYHARPPLTGECSQKWQEPSAKPAKQPLLIKTSEHQIDKGTNRTRMCVLHSPLELTSGALLFIPLLSVNPEFRRFGGFNSFVASLLIHRTQISKVQRREFALNG
jgi:hypothetical protein